MPCLSFPNEQRILHHDYLKVNHDEWLLLWINCRGLQEELHDDDLDTALPETPFVMFGIQLRHFLHAKLRSQIAAMFTRLRSDSENPMAYLSMNFAVVN